MHVSGEMMTNIMELLQLGEDICTAIADGGSLPPADMAVKYANAFQTVTMDIEEANDLQVEGAG